MAEFEEIAGKAAVDSQLPQSRKYPLPPSYFGPQAIVAAVGQHGQVIEEAQDGPAVAELP